MALTFITRVTCSVTRDQTWRTYDASGSVPAGASGVILCYTGPTDENNSYMSFRKGGTSTNHPYCVSNLGVQTTPLFVPVDSSRQFDYNLQSNAGTLYLIGYTTSEVVFPSSATYVWTEIEDEGSVWYDIDVSSYVTGYPVGVVLKRYNPDTGEDQHFEHFLGRYSDPNPAADCWGFGGDVPQAIYPLENNKFKLCQNGYFVGTKIQLVAYFSSQVTFQSGNYGVDVTPSSHGVYIDLSPSFTKEGLFYHAPGDSPTELRPDGIDEVQYSNGIGHAIVRSISNVIEAYSPNEYDFFYHAATFDDSGESGASYNESNSESLSVSGSFIENSQCQTDESFTEDDSITDNFIEVTESVDLDESIVENSQAVLTESFTADDTAFDSSYKVEDSFTLDDIYDNTLTVSDAGTETFTVGELISGVVDLAPGQLSCDLPWLTFSGGTGGNSDSSTTLPVLEVDGRMGITLDKELKTLTLEANILSGQISDLVGKVPFVSIDGNILTGRIGDMDRLIPGLTGSSSIYFSPISNCDSDLPTLELVVMGLLRKDSEILRYVRP